MKLIVSILLQAVLVTACSLPGPKAVKEPSAPAVATTKSAETKPAPVVEKAKEPKPVENLNLRQLDLVATTLRAIYDLSLMNPSPVVSPVLACDIKGEDAVAMMMPLKARMDEQIPRELKDYIRSPKLYAKNHNFKKCEYTCHCGLYASLLGDAVVEAGDESWHKAQLNTLQKKASKQTLDQSIACAKIQSWFCESGLRQELLSEL